MTQIRNPQRGDVYYADLTGIEQSLGSEQKGNRPVLVIQNNTGNIHSSTTIVAVISTKTKHWYPTHVTFFKPNILPQMSVVYAEQLKTIDKRRLGSYKGNIGPEIMKKVEDAIAISVGTVLNKQISEEYFKEMPVEVMVDEEEKGMYEMTTETKLDNVSHDWARMVDSQLLFFANVKQYLVNLKGKKRHLEAEIDTILNFIAETHFNSPQGYKVYTMLRERQKEKKQLDREIRSLELFVEYLDCEKIKRQYEIVAAKMDVITKETRTSATLNELLELVS